MMLSNNGVNACATTHEALCPKEPPNPRDKRDWWQDWGCRNKKNKLRTMANATHALNKHRPKNFILN